MGNRKFTRSAHHRAFCFCSMAVRNLVLFCTEHNKNAHAGTCNSIQTNNPNRPEAYQSDKAMAEHPNWAQPAQHVAGSTASAGGRWKRKDAKKEAKIAHERDRLRPVCHGLASEFRNSARYPSMLDARQTRLVRLSSACFAASALKGFRESHSISSFEEGRWSRFLCNANVTSGPISSVLLSFWPISETTNPIDHTSAFKPCVLCG